MEDFRHFNNQATTKVPREALTKFVPNEYGGIYDKPKTPKIGFIAERLNRDNLFTLIFFITVLTAVGIAETLAGNIRVSLTLPFIIPTLIVTLALLSKLNPLIFLNGVYTSESGKTFKQGEFFPGATLMFIAFWFTLFFNVMLILTRQTFIYPLYITVLLGFCLGIMIMYCILKNIPFSIFYYKKAWGSEGHNFTSKHSDKIFVPGPGHFTDSKHFVWRPNNYEN